jgi:hypothetical protein
MAICRSSTTLLAFNQMSMREIKKYPELTQKAAWRTYTSWKDWWNNGRHVEKGAPNASGGRIQEEARELVDYAACKELSYSEIEMPDIRKKYWPNFNFRIPIVRKRILYRRKNF